MMFVALYMEKTTEKIQCKFMWKSMSQTVSQLFWNEFQKTIYVCWSEYENQY